MVNKKLIIIPIIVLVLVASLFYFIVLPRYKIIKITNGAYEDYSSQLEIKDTIRKQLKDDFFTRFHNFTGEETKSMGGYYREHIIRISPFVEEKIEDKAIIFYDCDINANSCKNINVYTIDDLKSELSKISESVYKDEKFLISATIVEDGTLIIDFPLKASDEDLLSRASLFYLQKYKDLRKLKIASEIDEEYMAALRLPFDFELPKKPKGYKNIMIDFNSGKTPNLIKDIVLLMTEVGLGLGKVKGKANTAINEYSAISANKINATPFLDGSENIEDYKNWLDDSTNKLYQEYLSYPKKEENIEGVSGVETDSEKANKMVVKTMKELSDGLNDLKNSLIPSEIEKLRNSLNMEESQESKIIRLRILQDFIAKEIITNKCRTLSTDNDEIRGCILNIVDKTYQSNLYRYCVIRDLKCFAYIADKTNKPEVCNELYGDDLKEQCLNLISAN